LSVELNLYVDVIVDVYECEVDFGITDQLLNRYFISQMLEKNGN